MSLLQGLHGNLPNCFTPHRPTKMQLKQPNLQNVGSLTINVAMVICLLKNHFLKKTQQFLAETVVEVSSSLFDLYLNKICWILSNSLSDSKFERCDILIYMYISMKFIFILWNLFSNITMKFIFTPFFHHPTSFSVWSWKVFSYFLREGIVRLSDCDGSI